MKVDKAPQTHYFTKGWIEFHKDRVTGELKFIIKEWVHDITKPIERDSGIVKDKTHLKELQSQENV